MWILVRWKSSSLLSKIPSCLFFSLKVTSSLSLQDLISCPQLTKLVEKKFGEQQTNKFQVVEADDVSFVMIRSNKTLLMRDLDELRRKPKKFMCLNDDIDHDDVEEATAVSNLLHDFYESFLPFPSSFERIDSSNPSHSQRRNEEERRWKADRHEYAKSSKGQKERLTETSEEFKQSFVTRPAISTLTFLVMMAVVVLLLFFLKV